MPCIAVVVVQPNETTRLSILYLRCLKRRSVGVDYGRKRLSILYLRCLLYGSGYMPLIAAFQFSI